MTERRILLDTGPLVALLSAEDSNHQACVATLASLSPPLLTCWPVLTEASWLLLKRAHAVDHLVAAFDAGLLTLLPLPQESLPWIARFMRRYQDSGAQLADAAIVYLAEHEEIRTVFTLDRRDFSVYRLKRNRPFKIIPEVQ